MPPAPANHKRGQFLIHINRVEQTPFFVPQKIKQQRDATQKNLHVPKYEQARLVTKEQLGRVCWVRFHEQDGARLYFVIAGARFVPHDRVR